MFDTVKEQMQLGFKGRIIAFFILLFIIYGFIWAITEPLTIDWISKNPAAWRTILISAAILFTIIAFVFFFPEKILEKFDSNSNHTNLKLSVISTGQPKIDVELDGYQGKVTTLTIPNYQRDEMDWHVKPSTNRAKFVTVIYSPNLNFYFYLRLILASQQKTDQKYVWIRFEPTWNVPDTYNLQNPQEEMGYPVNATSQNNFHKINIDISKAVKDTFGQGGWKYGKTISFRIRGSGKVKEIAFS